ncbi:DNA cytosine methyltransferase [Rhodococcoides corynebacterioides]|uniref:DNA cytosine methyltransferase n=1 Tax=Rhodococcoides corynebacterioides TaxID=53972 RepID=UPI001C9AADB1|nr:DNA cytosine methyltransferase [Rhodococcus corynebacterioides]MBY6350817.1 DNA cytosine methyltransferase [Rhodococcus corynebacterioides]
MSSDPAGSVGRASYRVVEICAGAGGQALGLEKAGFEHELAVELDKFAVQTLRANRDWEVVEGDVADLSLWRPGTYEGIDLLAGGVPCPPFSVAGKQLGASDERDLFAWAVELTALMRPRALILENVRGLSTPRFAAYRQRILDRLSELGYVADWRLLQASDFGVPQLRPRFVLVAMREEDASFFYWPEVHPSAPTVGESLRDLMAARGWRHVDVWAELAKNIGPTLVGGSKKHGGADLGPTRAKAAWLGLGIDGKGIADESPHRDAPHPAASPPKLTIEMVSRLQGWSDREWEFIGGKTAKYRQIGNAFPPPVAEAVGRSLIGAFNRAVPGHELPELASPTPHDEIYNILRAADGFVTAADIIARVRKPLSAVEVERRIAYLSRDFDLDVELSKRGGARYRLGNFKGFTGQPDHGRHDFLESHRSRVS